MTSNINTFIQKINDAFREGDLQYFFDHLTDDIEWEMVGSDSMKGKDHLISEMSKMDTGNLPNITVTNTIIQGIEVACYGSMTMDDAESGEEKTYKFCDIYTLTDSTDLKIKKLISFVVDVS